MENDKLQELEQRLFELERAFDKNIISYEEYAPAQYSYRKNTRIYTKILK